MKPKQSRCRTTRETLFPSNPTRFLPICWQRNCFCQKKSRVLGRYSHQCPITMLFSFLGYLIVRRKGIWQLTTFLNWWESSMRNLWRMCLRGLIREKSERSADWSSYRFWCQEEMRIWGKSSLGELSNRRGIRTFPQPLTSNCAFSQSCSTPCAPMNCASLSNAKLYSASPITL